MKLVSFSTLIGCLTVTVNCQNNRDESFSFSSQFQTPNSVLHSSDSSIYLPPESHTPIPYYALDNMNKLPYQFLPSTASKAPSFYPTSFPIILSSTLKSIYEDDDDDDKEVNERQPIRRRLINVKQNQPTDMNNSSRQAVEKKEIHIIPKPPNYSNAEKRFDLRSPNTMPNTKILPQNSAKPAARRMIITSELQKIDHRADQEKSPSIQSMQYIQAAPGVYVSSTTEPAIPILRLSNEMDLDGSFSYEALGADQTHYVQHSHMENLGTDKEEQVVEGSYSYVGDDGRTYTVHYIADSNGYRASGDHLPVPPPIPEIIQRAVQYNLAEEAKKPAHLKSSWENEEYEVGEESRHNAYHMPPPRSLFTGKTPEAFSFGFSQTPTLIKTVNSQPSAKNNFDTNADQHKSKLNNVAAPILPQITFLASQGAHNPSVQSQSHSTKSVTIEKPSLPQLMNYEAQLKDTEQEANKALWRWQYGLNSNINNDPTNKNSISRSSSGSDDVYINFSDLTPTQYKEMMHSQILGKNIVDSNTIERSTEVQYSSPLYNDNINNMDDEKLKQMMTENYQTYTSTEINNLDSFNGDRPHKVNSNMYSDLITAYNFTPQSQVATKTYSVEDTSFEPTQINAISEIATKNYSSMYKNYYGNYNYIPNEFNPSPEIIIKQHQPVSSTMTPLNQNQQFEMRNEEQSTFKSPEIKIENDVWKRETTTTETLIENIVKQNIFLRNLFKVNENDNNNSRKDDESTQNNPAKIEQNFDKTNKFVPYDHPPRNDFTYPKSKPFDLSEVLNYVAMKNHFESTKTKPKTKPTNNFNYNFDIRDTSHYIPVKDNSENRENIKDNGDYRVLNNEQQKELHGLIKNYKVLQRRKNLDQKNSYLPEPQRNIKAFHTQSLPPLGRAGPSMKSYMPPTYL